MTVLMRYLTQQMLDAIKHITDDNTGALCV